jgi:putative inorganic carbon (HCO3(-)) transporter
MFKFIFGILLLGAGFYGAIFIDPIWGLYLFAALSHIRLEQLAESYALPLHIPIVIASLTLVRYVLSDKYLYKFHNWPAEVWLFGLMVLAMCISSAGAKFDPELSWSLTIDYLKYWIFFILMIQMIDSPKKIEWFHWVLILSSAWLVYRCWDLRGTTGPRFENTGGGNIGDANHFAAALILLFPFVFQKVFSRDWKVALGAAVLCFGMVMSVFITGSRGGLLGLVALVLILFWQYRGRRLKILAVFLVIGLVAITYLSSYQEERFSEFIAAGEDSAPLDDSAQLRLKFWGLAIELFTQNPFFGVSPGEFKYYSGYMVEGRDYGTAGHVTHSLWFEMLSRGLFVFIPFILMLVRFFRHSSRIMRRYKEAGENEMAMLVQTPMIALGAFLVPATFLDRSVYEPIYWCIALGIVHRYIFDERMRMVAESSSVTSVTT